MEAFSLLKYWRSGTSGGASPMMGSGPISSNLAQKTATTANALLRHSTSSDSSSSLDGDEDDGPFFDLEFSVPDDEEEEENQNGDVEEKRRGALLPPSDHVSFMGRLPPAKSSSDETAGKQHQFLPSGIFKSANKFSVFKLKGLKKPKSSVPAMKANKEQHQPQQSGNKFFTVKFKVEDVPIVSLFTRDNISRSSGRKHAAVDDLPATFVGGGKSSKEVVNRYLNMIKPLYVKVSRRSTEEKSRSSASAPGKIPEMDTMVNDVEKKLIMTHLQSRMDNGLRVVKKHLGKSRSASSAVASVPSSSPATLLVSRRRDDSLLQQQDGIQSAIAHCKRSFNATREAETTLPRSKSDSFDERSLAVVENCEGG